MRVARVGVVVPIHDEQDLLPRCLLALRAAAAGCAVPVHVVLVLDGCSDGSAASAALAAPLATSTTVLTADLHCVGAARALGCRSLLDRFGPAGTWLATTDADSAVPPDWLARGLAYAEEGYDAVAGTVLVDDSSPLAVQVRQAYLADYEDRWGHRHVHGANLALSAEAYLAVGGFAPVLCHEDARLVGALRAAGRVIAWADDLPVLTSGRTHSRVPGGFGDYLRALAEGDRPDAVA